MHSLEVSTCLSRDIGTFKTWTEHYDTVGQEDLDSADVIDETRRYEVTAIFNALHNVLEKIQHPTLWKQKCWKADQRWPSVMLSGTLFLSNSGTSLHSLQTCWEWDDPSSHNASGRYFRREQVKRTAEEFPIFIAVWELFHHRSVPFFHSTSSPSSVSMARKQSPSLM